VKQTVVLIAAWLVLAGWVRAANPALPVIPTAIFNVTNYGALGDGTKDNTTNIQNTIDAANAAGGGIIEVPAGTFLSGPITLYSSMNLRVDTNGILQMLPLGIYPGGATNAQTFIGCNGVHDLEISGSGTIDGQGAAWWAYFATNNTILRPMMLNLYTANRLFIHDITYQNPPYHHCGLRNDGGNITISNLTVFTVSPSPNTDGLNFVGTNSIIENCRFSEGDDNIAMGATGPLNGLLITNCAFGFGHGLSISGPSVTLSNLNAINCTFTGTSYGIRMKSDTNAGALVHDVSYLNLGMTNIVSGPIVIYSYYNEVGTPNNITPAIAAREIITPVNSQMPFWRNILISNLNATVASGGVAGIIWGRTEAPATNIIMSHVNITASKTFDVYNAQNVQFLDSIIKTGSGKTFTLWNAGIVVSNSVPGTNFVTFDGMGGNTNDSMALYNVRASMTSTDAFGCNPITLSGSVLTNTGNLTFSNNEVINFALGTNNASIVVAGNLVLNGTINITNAGGFTSNNYTLFTYTGSLGGAPVLGRTPVGYNCVLNTATAGLVKVVTTYTGASLTPTTTSVQTSANPAVYGTPVTFTATVSPAPTNGEAIAFEDGVNVLGTGPLNGGQAVFTTSGSPLVPGTHSITAVYSGDGAYAASSSAGLSQAINLPPGAIFADTFATSTVNSSTPTAPTANSASYEIFSGKSWNPPPSAGPGHLIFGIGSTSSGVVEAQALFGSPPAALYNPGDFVRLSLTFTDIAGILSQTGVWSFGLYNSGGSAPIGGGLNGSLNATSSNAVTGGAQNWQGYVAQIAFTGGNSGFYDRKAQSGTVNNNQDLVSISTSSSYQNPAASAIGTLSTAPSVALTVGGQYTEVLTFTLTASNTLQLASQLYTGPDSSGTLLSTMTADTGATPVANLFDGLAFGWRATGNTASTMDVNSIMVTTHNIPIVRYTVSGPLLTLSWPGYLGWVLQSNSVSLVSTNWSPVSGSDAVTNFSITPDSAQSNVFYRLISQ